MDNKSVLIMDYKSVAGNFISWLFGIIVFAIGLINTFWGNDPFFGLFLVAVSLIYFPPLNAIFTKMTGFKLPIVIQIALGIFVIFAALGVGELFDKIDLMTQSFK